MAGLLVPSFLVVILLLGALYQPFNSAIGDTPYGVSQTQGWFAQRAGYPDWLGPVTNTTPTGLPLVDAALHGDGPYFEVILLKTLWQALAIALVYASIYLRFVRHAVTDAFREPNIVAARSRGV